MVDVAGHLGMALVWMAPTWFVVRPKRTAATVVGVGFWFGVLPDLDLYLRRVLGTVHHHGVLHTVVGVSVVAVVVGPLLGSLLRRTLGGSDWFAPEAEAHAASLGILVVWIPGLSHVFADMLSAPDIAQSIEPFWPLYQESMGMDVVWYADPWVNWGLLVVGIALNAALYQSRWSRNSRSLG